MHKAKLDAILAGSLLYLILAGYAASAYALILALAYAFGLVPANALLFQPPWWFSVLALVLVAPTLYFVHGWVRSRVDDLIYGQHDDPYALLSHINRHLHNATSSQAMLSAAADTIVRMLKVPYAAVTVNREPAHAESGVKPAQARMTSLPIEHLDSRLGTLYVAARRARDPLSAADVRLLQDVARQIGIALRVAELTAEQQAAREQLVIAREEERRRIRNDLHDGLAPTLASLQLQLGATVSLIRQDPSRAAALIGEMRDDLRAATAAIRQLVYDLRPPLLDELGLVAAIRGLRLGDAALRLEVTAGDLPALPAAVEVAAYRIVSEAIHNVISHAQATCCGVTIAVEGTSLLLRIADDGRGVADHAQAGVGLRSMRERAAELGGEFQIEVGAPHGTTVMARLPIPEPPRPC